MIHKFLSAVFLLAFFSCNNSSSSDYDNSLPVPKVNNIPAPASIMFKVDAVYPHDPAAFTQGLEFHNGKFYEGTGEWGTEATSNNSHNYGTGTSTGYKEQGSWYNGLPPSRSIVQEGGAVFNWINSPNSYHAGFPC